MDLTDQILYFMSYHINQDEENQHESDIWYV